MYKHLIFIALALGLSFFMVSCSDPSLEGTWVEPAAEDSYLGEVGFTLLKNGEVKSINTGFREYTHWEQRGKKLIISGNINGSVPSHFADTLDIISVDKNQLVVGSDGYSVTYQKK